MAEITRALIALIALIVRVGVDLAKASSRYTRWMARAGEWVRSLLCVRQVAPICCRSPTGSSARYRLQ